ncbi:MAG TPA: DUF2497 domain-containing protein [Sphingobium sp.]|jgi:hypothetical protein|uniref:DUF2497 domain-containing protein n=1 Tax=unclassified Sphingobium TaxID=2611147 RepID=UPI0007F3E6D3|nr:MULTISPECIES: DUF2497 domain-containing protein [unclassified Sphingobium]OAN55510.1 hypothetical protein A7Q26_21300 [Sphingobium sp. TCM1]WIW88783.1 DUF2497 domain-containing protein [Sphingobium sp. V4]HAF41549.1 DUF2497 domain-containing protein [Sphingobium sp.]
MGDMTKEPSMEEILSSIKRIIAEEGEEAVQAAPRRARAEAAKPVPIESAVEEVLELTEEVAEEEVMPAPKAAAKASPVAAGDESILSVESEVAARHSLSALSSMLVAPKDGEDNTLEGLVRSMLKPMLKDWLDARLPVLVEEMVAKEIARITSR